ncbi:MAG TPA: (deoxy)nucleoside triphosphate pyrophosphohydrolase [Pirellulaceae bacterium]|nr:(deoxy)nucleoside triphosphate pyrophosphohydrolase [Pirellulaceae bacterium]
MPTPIAIAVVIDPKGLVLIGQRPAGVELAGMWEFPGGKIEPGETPEGAAKRECLEETGLTVAPTRCYSPEVHEYAHGAVELHFVWCLPYGLSFDPRGPYRWVPLKELPNYEFPAGNRRMIELLLAPPADDEDDSAGE